MLYYITAYRHNDNDNDNDDEYHLYHEYNSFV